ncbi:hypothetical protein [Flavobacterium sp.]|uniref:hypothetical protein n=1 Tax=Flavobacterium sp. TaxID=239 RepID=UPI00261078BD|nr:hypothetical protein [Flavobacterium sp.]
MSLFVVVSFFEIVAEFAQNIFLTSILKPFILPLLLGIYLIKSTSKSVLYILAIVINWIANILFLFEHSKYITLAAIFFIFSKLFVVAKVYKEIKLPSLFPFTIGTIPFLFLFIYLNFLIFQDIDFQTFLITIIHSVVMSLMGGIALGNYIMRNDKVSKFLLVSALFYAFNILFLGIKFYYIDLSFLKPLSMVFFILGHFSLLQFILLSERAK